MAAAALAHAGEKGQHELHGAEVIELHRALEVMEAIGLLRDGAPDRAARVVDQDVDCTVILKHLLSEALTGAHIRQVSRVDPGLAARGGYL